jgi:hypothetical protein
MLVAESTPWPQCSWKDYVNEIKINDTIGNRTRDLSVCSALSQPPAPARIPTYLLQMPNIRTVQ